MAGAVKWPGSSEIVRAIWRREKFIYDDEDHYRCDYGMVMGQNQIGRHTGWIREWKLTSVIVRCDVEDETEGIIHGCARQLKGMKFYRNSWKKRRWNSQERSLNPDGREQTGLRGVTETEVFCVESKIGL